MKLLIHIYMAILMLNLLKTDGFLMYNTFFNLYRRLTNKTNKDNYKHVIPNIHVKTIKNPSRLIKYNSTNKVIISTPSGLNGFYLLGITSYIKENFDLTNYIYSGASAGAWNSLFLAFKGNDTEFINILLNSDIHNATSVVKIENTMNELILDNYTENDFDLDKINIGVSILKWFFKFQLNVYNDFTCLNDTLNCCMTSSHIPFITGGLLRFYRNECCFDGGFLKYPYVNNTPILTIKPDLWNSTYTTSTFLGNILQMNKLNVNLTELYIQGYNDTKNNHEYLTTIFL